MYRAASSGREQVQQLPVTVDVREMLLDFYRERDRQDAERYARGEQRIRGDLYASGVARLESEADVYESYRVVRAAGVEMPRKAEAIVEALPQDWRHVCRVDPLGGMWTASLREKRALDERTHR